jgi:RNA polymerase sigma factor (sigma-70 family)
MSRGAVVDEGELLARSQQGNVAAFNQLVMAYQEMVYNVALRIMGDPEAAADATQDAFISAFRSIHSYRGGSFKVWLLRIVTNACYDELRTRKRRPTESLDAMDATSGHEESARGAIASSLESPEDYALRQDMRAQIQQGLLALPEDQRVVIVLSDVQGFSYEEISAITNSSLGTVKSRLSRGRARLRDFLQERELSPSTGRL